MCESMTQLYRVGEEERVLVKPFRRVKSMTTHGKETPANFSASSRGNTGGVSVIQIDWAYIACRWGSAALGLHPSAYEKVMSQRTSALGSERGGENGSRRRNKLRYESECPMRRRFP